MSESKPPLGSDFDKARDWRAHQLTLLSVNERVEYDRIAAEGNKREQAKAKERESTVRQRIEEETRRKLLAKRNLVLELFQSEKARRREAAQEAERTVRIADENARKQDAIQTREETDRYLRDKEKQRQMQRAVNQKEQAQCEREALARRFNERTRFPDRSRDGGRSR